MKVKHWAGTITARSFAEIPTVPAPGTDPLKVIHDNKTFQKILQWGLAWQQRAMKAETGNKMLVVFEIPIAAEIELVSAIETFLQERPETKRLKTDE
jgi:hypothetical protein